MEPYDLNIRDAAALLRKREFSAVELTRSVLDRVAQVEPLVHAFITVTQDLALERAAAADRRLAQGDAPFLCGIPLAIKDIFCTKGVRTTAASQILGNFVPHYESTPTARLVALGAVMVGKANMDEFAMGSSTENSSFGPSRNPWKLTHTPGGSSGGSAVAVAAGQCLGSLGTDTGGSIRQPAALTGVVGIKPTYGRVSRFGVIAYASSLDQVGPFAADVAGCAVLLAAIAGKDPLDMTSVEDPVPDYLDALTGNMKGMRIGVPAEYFTEGIDPEVEASIRGAIDRMRALGATVVEVSLPHTEYAIAAYYLVATAEASSNLARYDVIRYGHRAAKHKDLMDLYCRTRAEGFGAEVKRRIMLGTYSLSAGYYDAYYKKSQQVRTLIRQDFTNAFKSCDLLVTPTSPTPAFPLGSKIDDPLAMYLSDIYTISTNLAGLPGLSLPCGFSGEGLPIGLQLIGQPLGEPALFRAAHAYEQSTDHHLRRPPLRP